MKNKQKTTIKIGSSGAATVLRQMAESAKTPLVDREAETRSNSPGKDESRVIRAVEDPDVGPSGNEAVGLQTGNQTMEVRALTKNVRISPEKARHVSRVIQGKSVVEALAIVELSPRKAAALIGATLRSAVANAENNCDVNRKALVVKAALVSPGPIIKRFRPKARGSAGRIRKRTSHIEVILSDN